MIPKCPICNEKLNLDKNMNIIFHHCYPIHKNFKNMKLVDFDSYINNLGVILK